MIDLPAPPRSRPRADNSTAAGMRTALTLLLLAVLLIPSLAFSQTAAPACPPPPAIPTTDEIQAMIKTATDRGFLWKYDKEGHTGYLYGSIHLGRRDWIVPGPKTMAALRSSGVIALELDILDPQIRAQLSDPSRAGIESMTLPPPLQLRMNTVARRVCAPDGALAALHPLMQLITLTMLQARFSDLEPGYGSEMFLAGFARGAKKPIESLETADIQLRALLAGDVPRIVQMIESGLTLFETGRQQAQTERLLEIWATSNLDELQRYEQWCECLTTEADRKYIKGLLDERNPHLAAGIDRLTRNGRTVFAAVGALHMVGPNSVPKLLEKMGYKIERVVFDTF